MFAIPVLFIEKSFAVKLIQLVSGPAAIDFFPVLDFVRADLAGHLMLSTFGFDRYCGGCNIFSNGLFADIFFHF